MATLSSLPPELTREILEYLPIKSLLAFGSTSKGNHAFQSISFSKLHIGVLESRFSSTISLIEAGADLGLEHSIQKVLPQRMTPTKDMVIRQQNVTIQAVLMRYQLSLRILELALWELHEYTTIAIAQLRNLQHLSIKLDHPYTRAVDRSFWETSPGSTIWNNLFSRTGNTSDLGRLRSLNLERAGLTDYQLQRVLESNPRIINLRLQKCFNLTQEIFEFLARSSVGKGMQVLCFTKSGRDGIDNQILQYIGNLSSLRVRDMQTRSGLEC